MKADPTAVRLHRAYVPYSHVRRPQRVSVRQQMHGRIQPMDRPPDRSARYFIALAVVIAGYFAVQEARPLLHAASVVRPQATGSPSASFDARRR